VTTRARTDLMLTAALDLAAHGWAILPLAGKVPAIPNPHRDQPARNCRGTCGQPGHGVLDATTDPDTIHTWWAGPYRGANIGARVPAHLIVIDVDPRNGGTSSLTAWEAKHGQLPVTLSVWSGRGDGGRHLYWRRPPGPLSSRALPDGIDLKTSAGYCVMPPSIHPAGRRQPYRWSAQPWHTQPVLAPPAWLASLLTEQNRTPAAVPARPASSRTPATGGSVIEAFNESTTWQDVLGPHEWRCLRGDGDQDGSSWVHPTATSSCSATVTGGRLYVYSTNTVFTPTEPGHPHGYSRFDAHTLLHHQGDARQATRQIRTTGAIG